MFFMFSSVIKKEFINDILKSKDFITIIINKWNNVAIT